MHTLILKHDALWRFKRKKSQSCHILRSLSQSQFSLNALLFLLWDWKIFTETSWLSHKYRCALLSTCLLICALTVQWNPVSQTLGQVFILKHFNSTFWNKFCLRLVIGFGPFKTSNSYSSPPFSDFLILPGYIDFTSDQVVSCDEAPVFTNTESNSCCCKLMGEEWGLSVIYSPSPQMFS